MPLPALIPVVGAIISAVGWADIGVYIISGKDIIEHTTGVDVIGGFLDWIWPNANDGPPSAPPAEGLLADPFFFLAITVALAGIAGLLWTRRKRRYEGGY